MNQPLVIRALATPGSLTGELVRRLSDEIRNGGLKPGDRLPTEAEVMRQTGVSRTVVREAVAALKAEGLVITRQGVGAFVADPQAVHGFRIDTGAQKSLAQVLKVLELRLAVEVEAAGRAATMRSAEQMRAIAAAQAAFRTEIEAGVAAVETDFAFHRTVLAATGNEYFPSFLDFLGKIIIPRQTFSADRTGPEERRHYLLGVAREHDAVVEAIAGQDAEGARAAMRRHLEAGYQRYQKMAADLQRRNGAHA
jgi:DNA-binding FadR family transcriptional regulator